MIPYFIFTEISLGPFSFHTWGIMVGIGILAAVWVACEKAKQEGLDNTIILNWSSWIIVAAFIGARLGYVFFYDWSYFATKPFDIIKIWQGGLSLFGGFIGAAIVSLLYVRVKKIDFWHIFLGNFQTGKSRRYPGL